MDGLDFSALSDDQLLVLIRAALREAADRHPGMATAAKQAMLDEQDRMRVLAMASEREIAALRAAERERLACDAAEAVRHQHAATRAKTERVRATRAAEEAREKAARELAEQRRWLERAADLVVIPARDLSIVYAATQYGNRVLINHGRRYEREHLSDWRRDDGSIKTIRALISRKPDLAALSAEFAACHKPGDALDGAELFQ